MVQILTIFEATSKIVCTCSEKYSSELDFSRSFIAIFAN